MALSLQRYVWHYYRIVTDHNLKERDFNGLERSPVLAINIGDNLPENVIVEILSWLPVKALLQFKSVCKSWYAIISSHDFVSRHLRNYYKHKSDDNDCLLVQYYVSHAELQLYALLLDGTPRVVAHGVLYDMPMYGAHVCGPCDGIYYMDLDFTDVGRRGLWNPAINDVKVFPPIITKPNLPSSLEYAMNEVYGFGYVTATDDYKVVIIKGYWSTLEEESEVRPPLSVLIYSLRTGSWRYWGDLAKFYNVENNKCYIAVDGCVYWLTSEQDENPEIIISFDLVTEEAGEMHLPDYDQPASKSLGIYDDSLAFLAVCEIEERLDIWTWKDKLWTKKFMMGPIPDVQRPIGHWKKNQIIVECGHSNLVLCDPATQEIKDLAFEKGRWCEGAFAFRESLLSLNDRKDVGARCRS